MKCYYHNDLDGRCAGAIVYRTVAKRGSIEMIEVDYKDEIDVDRIEDGEEIIIVDFSFKPEVMEKVLIKTSNVVWIDHHKTAFEYKYSKELEGLRLNEYSGCELAWKYFTNNAQTLPEAVKLIGDRDKWAWKFGERTRWFNLGLQLYPHQPKDIIWDDLLISEIGVENIIGDGSLCQKFRDNFCKDYMDSYGFETDFEGYKCFACGLYMFGSEAFGDRFEQYDMCISFELAKNKWTIGLYSKTIDVSIICQKFGGGGHKGAGGFVSKELPFN
jgi:oligoribonuclease NrnB/cAMP/cGMP phosphodiesterase (DHH superfamily)